MALEAFHEAHKMRSLSDEDPGSELIWLVRSACLAHMGQEPQAAREVLHEVDLRPKVAPQTHWLEFVRQTAWGRWLAVLCGTPEDLAAVAQGADQLERLQPELEGPFLWALQGSETRRAGNELMALYLLASAAATFANQLTSTDFDSVSAEATLARKLGLMRSSWGRVSSAFNTCDAGLLLCAGRALLRERQAAQRA